MEFVSRIVQTEFRRFATREDHWVTDTPTRRKAQIRTLGCSAKVLIEAKEEGAAEYHVLQKEVEVVDVEGTRGVFKLYLGKN